MSLRKEAGFTSGRRERWGVPGMKRGKHVVHSRNGEYLNAGGFYDGEGASRGHPLFVGAAWTPGALLWAR